MTSTTPVRLLLFDLDDTLWDMPKTLAHAEDKWQQFMTERGYGELAQQYRKPRPPPPSLVPVPKAVAALDGTSGPAVPPVRLLLFDLDDTLWDVNRTLDLAERQWQELMRRWGFDEIADTYKNYRDLMVLIEAKRNEWSADYWESRRPYWNYCELRKHVYMDIIHHYLLQKGQYASEKDIASVAKTLSEESFQVWLSARHEVAWFEGAIVTLRAIKQRYPEILLGAVSNGTTDLDRIPEARGLFDFSMSALDANCTKPEPEIYLKAIKAADATPAIKPEETVFIGDDYLNDVCGPSKVGLRTIWMNAKRRPMTTVEPITGKTRPGFEGVADEDIKPTKTILDIRQLLDALDDLQASLAVVSRGYRVMVTRWCSGVSRIVDGQEGSEVDSERATEGKDEGQSRDIQEVDPMKVRLTAVPKPETGVARRSVEQALLDERRKKYMELYESTGIARYLPPKDPNSFLIEKERLSGTEQRAQRVFAFLPWLTFGIMLVAPYYGMKWALAKIDAQVAAEAAAAATEAQSEPRAIAEDSEHPLDSIGFRVMDYWALPEVLESPLPHLLVLYDNTYASTVFLPVLRSLAASLARATKGQMSTVAVELPKDEASKDLLKQYPRSRSPHIQFIVPRATSSGEAGVLDYGGRWNMQELVRTFILPTLLSRTAVTVAPERRRKLVQDAQHLDVTTANLWSDCLFTLRFMPRKTARNTPSWSVEDSLSLSLDEAVDRCRRELTEEERKCI
ncbi:hypothetical protein FOL47_006008 [Perkinsus chesapeaki]|uniref:Haloacid dehalogenase-like hydrolase domain-containing protein 3 n=1 Tax=Perkinsus chesapeaki TaxID=330153 RepID=A0A7J6LUE4_PERCH|nr:hypothetical protein FOL47_006008 [Perkinsus chesapeaki]